MLIAQQWRLSRRLAGQEAIRSIGIERQNPVPNNLAPNSPRLRRRPAPMGRPRSGKAASPLPASIGLIAIRRAAAGLKCPI